MNLGFVCYLRPEDEGVNSGGGSGRLVGEIGRRRAYKSPHWDTKVLNSDKPVPLHASTAVVMATEIVLHGGVAVGGRLKSRLAHY